MAIIVFFAISIIFLAMGIFVYIEDKNFYNTGIKSTGKVINIEEYSYLSLEYHLSDINKNIQIPSIEVIDEEGKAQVVIYNSINDNISFKVGEKVEVVYPKGEIQKLRIYEKLNFHKNSIGFYILAGLFSILAVIVPFIC